MHRALFITAGLALVVGCGDDTGDTSGTTDTSAAEVEFHPLLPEDDLRQDLWNWREPCELQNGGAGSNLYWDFETSSSSEDSEGVRTWEGTETFYLFTGSGFVDEDCKETWTLYAQAVTANMEQLGCGSCEEVYVLSRVRDAANSTCNIDWSGIFGYGGRNGPSPPATAPDQYEHLMLFDTIFHFNNEPYKDNVMALISYMARSDRGWTGTGDWANQGAKAFPIEGAEKTGPYNYEWTGYNCTSIQ